MAKNHFVSPIKEIWRFFVFGEWKCQKKVKRLHVVSKISKISPGVFWLNASVEFYQVTFFNTRISQNKIVCKQCFAYFQYRNRHSFISYSKFFCMGYDWTHYVKQAVASTTFSPEFYGKKAWEFLWEKFYGYFFLKQRKVFV